MAVIPQGLSLLVLQLVLDEVDVRVRQPKSQDVGLSDSCTIQSEMLGRPLSGEGLFLYHQGQLCQACGEG